MFLCTHIFANGFASMPKEYNGDDEYHILRTIKEMNAEHSAQKSASNYKYATQNSETEKGYDYDYDYDYEYYYDYDYDYDYDFDDTNPRDDYRTALMNGSKQYYSYHLWSAIPILDSLPVAKPPTTLSSDGEEPGDKSGRSVALSTDNSLVLKIGAPSVKASPEPLESYADVVLAVGHHSDTVNPDLEISAMVSNTILDAGSSWWRFW
mgnify:CR=1 FL=1|tara:strand:+ start:3453 stop:4076 length:624 start_codon:yes stop_codon:yes gene_type:complete